MMQNSLSPQAELLACRRSYITGVSYNPFATLYCIGSFVATISANHLSVTLAGAKESPCGCPAQPIPGVSPVNPNCFVPSGLPLHAPSP